MPPLYGRESENAFSMHRLMYNAFTQWQHSHVYIWPPYKLWHCILPFIFIDLSLFMRRHTSPKEQTSFINKYNTHTNTLHTRLYASKEQKFSNMTISFDLYTRSHTHAHTLIRSLYTLWRRKTEQAKHENHTYFFREKIGSSFVQWKQLKIVELLYKLNSMPNMQTDGKRQRISIETHPSFVCGRYYVIVYAVAASATGYLSLTRQDFILSFVQNKAKQKSSSRWTESK